ncbi:MAG: hypothetical protein KAW89_01845, partial [Armatimonadetes bacterium]|nr:hypothetical protein [Armatimonadota bacterium]
MQAITQAIVPRNKRRAHPFFTAQPNSVVEAYIRALSEPGEIVLDPFCGSGVTPYEALLAGRRAIAVDLVPLSCLVTKLTCLALPDLAAVDKAFGHIKAECADYINNLYEESPSFFDDVEIDCWYPRGIRLPA